jgi:YjbE family integral membrane protein
MSELWRPDVIAAFLQVITIDLVLAADNAIVIGLAAAGLAAAQRHRAIALGIFAATGLRVIFAAITVHLLRIVGLLLAGGLLLLWVCWKMWRELRQRHHHRTEPDGTEGGHVGVPRKTLRQAAWQIVVADVSMSLDNVLAVAGAAREHPMVLVFGLVLSIGLVGVAASIVARLFNRHQWIAYVGLAVILYVAVNMMFEGSHQVLSLATLQER